MLKPPKTAPFSSVFPPLCLLAAGLLVVAPTLSAAPAAASRAGGAEKSASLFAAPMPLRLGATALFPLPANATFKIETGEKNVAVERRGDSLAIKALREGAAQVRVTSPGQNEVVWLFSVGEISSKPSAASVGNAQSFSTEQLVTHRASAQVAAPAPDEEPLPDYLRNLPAPTIAVPGVPVPSVSAPAPPVVPALPPLGAPLPTPTPLPAEEETANPDAPESEPAATVIPTLPAAPPARVLPAPAPSPAPRSTVAPVRSNAPRTVTTPVSDARAPQISPNLPAPATTVRPNVNYRPRAGLPQNVNASSARQTIQVTQGLARLLSFSDNILSVFFSDPAVMDARAINARTIAITGIGPGQSTLAIFTSRYPGDVVGKANVYRLQTTPKGGAATLETRSPQTVQNAISAALNDPRIRVLVSKVPDGSLVARLSGTVRNPAEVAGAAETASFYVPRVVSSLYADANAPSIDAVLSGAVNLSPESGLRDNLRRITGNDSIELVPLPNGIAFKAEVGSTGEAEALLRILPSLNQQVIPFIVVRGQSDSDERYYNSTVPLLVGEDLQLTQKLQSVTGIRTVYAVRASSNSVAIYGNVRNRSEYEIVNRYSYVVAQNAIPPAVRGTSQGGAVTRPQGFEGPNLPSYDPVAGYFKQLGVQLFVRITDPSEATVRNVTVETNIVEISRTALKDLGLQLGSVALTEETISEGADGSSSVERVIDPTFNPGIFLGGNGFIGTGGFSNIDPFRARLNALATKGDARILAQPNVRALEGTSAQITLGGERPVPSAVATNGAAGQSVEFRRYGVIVSMRPTVTDDNTIILQIRADVTQPDRTFEINLNGALIPGETVRSVDTTMTMRPGDTVILGGLMTNEKRQSTSKVPILGDLPIIGPLFRSKRFENNETELAIFMTPRIEALPATMDTKAKVNAAPGYPALPSRQESNAILFQNTRQ